MAAGKLVLRLDAVVDDLRDFAKRSGHPTEVLSAEAYQRQVKELVGQPGSYVLATTHPAKFKGGRVLRGVSLSPIRLAETLQIDSALRNPQIDREEDPARPL
jgi:hypothetical protein